MHKYLTQDIEFNKFPSLFSHHYIKGMLIQTFQALLQICSMRIYLYAVAVDDTYNSRAISTLPSESYFSDMKRIDKDGKGYTKGPAVNKLVRNNSECFETQSEQILHTFMSYMVSMFSIKTVDLNKIIFISGHITWHQVPEVYIQYN